jgi:hypothetical protein
MRTRPWDCLLLLILAAASGCSDSHKSPVSPTVPDSAATVTAVKVTLDGSPTFGAHLPLSAKEILSNGNTRDCTAAAAWVSSDSRIGLIQDQGIFFGVGVGQTVISATCHETRGDLPVTVASAPDAPNAVRIAPVGALVNLGIGQTRQLQSIMYTVNKGNDIDCTSSATWTSLNPSVATVSSQGMLTAVAAGTTRISVVCQGITGADTAFVLGGVNITISMTEPEPLTSIVIPEGTVEILDGPGSGRVLPITAGFVNLRDLSPPFSVRVTAPGYQTTQASISTQTGTFLPDQNSLGVRVPMRPVPAEPGVDEIIDRVGASPAIYHVNVHGAGPFSTQIWWSFGEYTDGIALELSCNGAIIATADTVTPSYGAGFSTNVSAPCDYQVRLTTRRGDPINFRLRIKHPS